MGLRGLLNAIFNVHVMFIILYEVCSKIVQKKLRKYLFFDFWRGRELSFPHIFKETENCSYQTLKYGKHNCQKLLMCGLVVDKILDNANASVYC